MSQPQLFRVLTDEEIKERTRALGFTTGYVMTAHGTRPHGQYLKMPWSLTRPAPTKEVAQREAAEGFKKESGADRVSVYREGRYEAVLTV